jgi:hypothetical protein
MNISFCTVVLSLIQGIAHNTDVPPCSQGWGVTQVEALSKVGSNEEFSEDDEDDADAAGDEDEFNDE